MIQTTLLRRRFLTLGTMAAAGSLAAPAILRAQTVPPTRTLADTMAGDSRFADRARAALADLNARSALLLVSHQAETVRAFCKTAAILQDGRLTRYDDLDQAIAAYQAA